jgi:hypothetical protein
MSDTNLALWIIHGMWGALLLSNLFTSQNNEAAKYHDKLPCNQQQHHYITTSSANRK